MLAHDLSRALDPIAFAADCGLPDLDDWQAELLAGDHRRALLLCCRQAGKSTITALLALWIAIYEAPALILLVSPSQRQSAELFRRVLQFLRHLDGAPEVELESVLKLELRNGSRIISLPGSEATVRGFSAARLVVIDEAARVPDDLLVAIRPTLATSTDGRLVALSTPFGRRGWFFDAWEHGGPEWHRVMVTADQCSRISPAFLDQERRELGELRYSEEYACQFVDGDEQIFASEMIEAAFTPEVAPLWT